MLSLGFYNLVCTSKSIRTPIKVNIFLESTDLHQLIEVTTRVPKQLEMFVISAWSWISRSKNAHFDHVSQIQAMIKTTLNSLMSHLMTFMNCWRSQLSKNVLIFIVALILYELQTKTFGQFHAILTGKLRMHWNEFCSKLVDSWFHIWPAGYW